jgi:UDP-N-acetylglucosamine 2-epimerase (non-hydrolysing)
MILIAFGTRPEIIKLFPVIKALKKHHLPFKTLFSGQQLDLFKDVMELVSSPDFSFADIFSGKGKHNSLGASFAKICHAAETLFSKNKFDFVIVQGDTTTAWALSLLAFYNDIKVAHVEAGLRTFDLYNPYPEELNRTLIGKIAHLHFAPTKRAYETLIQEGARVVHLVGNTIVDAVNYYKKNLTLKTEVTNKILVTLHRRENHVIMKELFLELEAIAQQNSDLELIFPIHPNPNVRRYDRFLKADNIKVINPISYPDTLRLMSQVHFIITDSGGIQEEATCFNKKVIVAREKTERPELIECGLGVLSGRNISNFVEWARIAPPPLEKSPYGEGNAAEKIAQVLVEKVK